MCRSVATFPTPGHSIVVAVRGADVAGMACLAPPHKWSQADAADTSSSRKLVGEELRLSIAPVSTERIAAQHRAHTMTNANDAQHT